MRKEFLCWCELTPSVRFNKLTVRMLVEVSFLVGSETDTANIVSVS